MQPESKSTIPFRPSAAVEKEIELHREASWATLPPQDQAFVMSWSTSRSEAEVRRELSLSQAEVRRRLSDPIIRAAIADAQEQVFSQSLVSARQIEEDALHLLGMAMGRVPVPVIDRDTGEQTEAYSANLPVAKGVLEFLGREKDYGNKNKLEVNGNIQVDWTDAMKKAGLLEQKPEAIDGDFVEVPPMRQLDERSHS